MRLAQRSRFLDRSKEVRSPALASTRSYAGMADASTPIPTSAGAG